MTELALDEVTPEELLDLLGRATDGSDVTTEEVAAFLASKAPEKTKARVLAYLSRVRKKVAKLALAGEPDAEVIVRQAHRGRVTGWSMACLGCGLVAPRLAPSKRLASVGALGHLRTDHDGIGTVDLS